MKTLILVFTQPISSQSSPKLLYYIMEHKCICFSENKAPYINTFDELKSIGQCQSLFFIFHDQITIPNEFLKEIKNVYNPDRVFLIFHRDTNRAQAQNLFSNAIVKLIHRRQNFQIDLEKLLGYGSINSDFTLLCDKLKKELDNYMIVNETLKFYHKLLLNPEYSTFKEIPEFDNLFAGYLDELGACNINSEFREQLVSVFYKNDNKLINEAIKNTIKVLEPILNPYQ